VLQCKSKRDLLFMVIGASQRYDQST
jgi:hypothetical protein